MGALLVEGDGQLHQGVIVYVEVGIHLQLLMTDHVQDGDLLRAQADEGLKGQTSRG